MNLKKQFIKEEVFLRSIKKKKKKKKKKKNFKKKNLK
jgi:hypothetical protein